MSSRKEIAETAKINLIKNILEKKYESPCEYLDLLAETLVREGQAAGYEMIRSELGLPENPQKFKLLKLCECLEITKELKDQKKQKSSAKSLASLLTQLGVTFNTDKFIRWVDSGNLDFEQINQEYPESEAEVLLNIMKSQAYWQWEKDQNQKRILKKSEKKELEEKSLQSQRKQNERRFPYQEIPKNQKQYLDSLLDEVEIPIQKEKVGQKNKKIEKKEDKEDYMRNGQQIEIEMTSDLLGEEIKKFKISHSVTGKQLKSYIFYQVLDYLPEDQMDLFYDKRKIKDHKKIYEYTTEFKKVMKINQKISEPESEMKEQAEEDNFERQNEYMGEQGLQFSMTCGHKIQKDCLVTLVQNMMLQKESQIKCPYMKEDNKLCNSIWDFETCLEFAGFTFKESQEIKETLSKNWMEQMTIRCSNEICGIILSKENTVSMEDVIICPECGELIITEEIVKAQSAQKFQYVNPLCQTFSLKNEVFNIDKNQYFGKKTVVEFRGGYPYYQPPRGKRYGLKVNGKYDKGNDQWLGTKGENGEWADAFHGVKNPMTKYNGTTVFNSIMKGLDTGQMLKAGGGQGYAHVKSDNLPGQMVGSGVYFSPHIEVCLQGYALPIELNKIKYRVVLQCKINPKKLKVCSTANTYWVVNNSEDIRPYGVILVSDEQYVSYPNSQSLFGEYFTWAKYQHQVNAYLNKQKW